ncbi:MAG: DUF86 domain-containing protein [Desulfobacteraceae bacterium]|nr:DUF86 domain-containing protein [Desulfobacteraceae bacterium]
MSHRNWQFRIQDILDAAQLIIRYTENMTFEQFQKDQKTVDAVLQQLMIIGEAASHVPDGAVIKSSDIDWKQIRGIRNVIVHEYFRVSKQIVWNTVKEDLPFIIEPLKKLLSSEDQDM